MHTNARRRLSTVTLGFFCAFTAGCLAASGESDEELAGDVAGDEDTENGGMALGPNLVKNPGFESGFNNWSKADGSGGTCQLVTGAGAYLRTKDPSVAGYAFVLQEVPITAGKKYHLLVRTRRRSGPANPEFGISIFGDAPDGLARKAVLAGTSTDWHWRSFDVVAPAGATHAYVWLGGYSDVAASTYDWDGVGMHAY
jgi:hypothetical protein